MRCLKWLTWVQMIKTLFKVAIGVLLFWFFAMPTLTSFNDSYEEKFCKKYAEWNKYAWSVANQNSENWQTLEQAAYGDLIDIVENESPSNDNYLTKIASQWFFDSAAGDYASGKTMAAILVVECEKNGVKFDDKYFSD